MYSVQCGVGKAKCLSVISLYDRNQSFDQLIFLVVEDNLVSLLVVVVP